MFVSHGKQKGYKKLLLSSMSMSGIDKIPTQNKYENSLEGEMDLNKKIVKLNELDQLAYEDIILLINTGPYIGKMAFRLVRTAKSVDFPEGNCKIMWDRLMSKFLHIKSHLC